MEKIENWKKFNERFYGYVFNSWFEENKEGSLKDDYELYVHDMEQDGFKKDGIL